MGEICERCNQDIAVELDKMWIICPGCIEEINEMEERLHVLEGWLENLKRNFPRERRD